MATVLGRTTTSNRVTVALGDQVITGFVTNVVATTNTADTWNGSDYRYVSPSMHECHYTIDFIADPYGTPREKENDVDLIDALFILKPRLKKKYKADRDAFRKDVLAAAEFQQAAVAFDKLDDLLALEI